MYAIRSYYGFQLEYGSKEQSILGEHSKSRLEILTDVVYPRIQTVFGGDDKFRETLIIDVDEFIGVKGYKARGKRLSTYSVAKITELEPTRFPDPEPEVEPEIDDDTSTEDLDNEDKDQMSLF